MKLFTPFFIELKIFSIYLVSVSVLSQTFYSCNVCVLLIMFKKGQTIEVFFCFHLTGCTTKIILLESINVL
jgi:hypothetical protein